MTAWRFNTSCTLLHYVIVQLLQQTTALSFTERVTVSGITAKTIKTSSSSLINRTQNEYEDKY